jgi:hypothetical protein
MMGKKLKRQKKKEFYASTIAADVQDGILTLGVTDFSHTSIIAIRPRTSVEFEAGISRDEAVAALEAVIEIIENHGLPAVCLPLDSGPAKYLERMLKICAAGRRDYDCLSAYARQKFRSSSANQQMGALPQTFYAKCFRLFKLSVYAKEEAEP